MRIDPANRSLEIGGTWVAPRWRRSFVNTRVKYQLLAYCFEQLRAERIELRVDARNTASQRAVLRLGATFEGRLRNRQIFPDGTTRDGFMFSFTRPEWPQVEERLRRLLNGEPSPAREPYFPRAFGSRRLELRCFEAADAGAVFTLIDKNRPVLAGVFPRTERALREKSAADGYVVERLTQWNARSAFCYGVFLRETGSLIGQLQFKSIDWSARGCEMGYFLDEKYHRQGIGSEMGTAAIGMAFGEMKFRRLALRILPSNAASLALARTLGVEPEGCHRKEFSGLNGELQDILYYSRVQG
jgi:RimJ/RimL family protein N-acetyltransferase